MHKINKSSLWKHQSHRISDYNHGFPFRFHMPHSSVHVLSVIISRKLFIKFYSFWSQGKKKKKKRYRCSRVNSSWSSGHVSAAGMCSLLTAEQGNAANTTRPLQRAKSGCGRSCVSPQRGFMVGSGFWTGPGEHGGERRAAFTLRTQILLLIPEEFVGFQTHLIPTVMNKSHACVDQQQTLLSLSFSCSRLHFTVPKKVYKFYLDLPRKLHASDQDLDDLWCCSVNIVWRAQEAHRKHAVLYM